MSRALLVVMALASVANADELDPLHQLLAHTDEIAKQVARTRGLRFKKKVPNEVVDRAELRKRLAAEAHDDKTIAETAAEGIALKRWDLIPIYTDYEAMLLDVLSDQIAGYYDPKTKKLTILDSAANDEGWALMVLAHELDHGLQDQAFDLEKFEKVPDDDDDALAARHALVEGDGVALMLEVAMPEKKDLWADPAVAELVVASMNNPDQPDSMANVPLAISESMLFPYRDGFKFVADLRRTKPWSAIDAAFKRPPRSTEQILHVEKYLADEKPIAVAATEPLAGYELVESTVWGELGTRSFLRAHGVDAYISSRAAAGWGGDRVLAFAKAGETNARRAIGVARFEWDTENDAREAQAAFEHALEAINVGGTIDQTMERTRWQNLDGTRSWIERKGKSLVIVIGAPLATDVDGWALTKASSARGRRGG
ncbi:MAG TPA: hypothetical protein VGC41_19675 [Kofleriaceae bacterium]